MQHFFLFSLAFAGLVVGAPLPPHTLTWAPLGEPGCGGDIVSARYDPFNTSRIYISGDMLGVGVSLDDGKTWSSPTPTSFLSWEMADFTFDPLRRVTYVASMSGPYVSSWDDPLNFTALRQGFPAPSAPSHTAATQKVLVDPTVIDGSRLLAFGGTKRKWAGQANMGVVWESLDAGVAWHNLTLIVPGTGGNVMYADWCGPQCIWAAVDNHGMYRSDDGGRTWALRSGGLPPAFAVGYAANLLDNGTTAYAAGCGAGGIWKTTDGGTSWATINTGLDAGECYESFGLASDGVTLYAGGGNTQSHIWVSGNAGASWTASGPPPTSQAYGLGLGASFLSVHPSDPLTVLHATWVTQWRSRDGGATWQDITASQPNASDPYTWTGNGFSGLVSTSVQFCPFSGRAFLNAMDAGKIWASGDPQGRNLSAGWVRQRGLNLFGGGNEVSCARDGVVYAGTGQDGWPTSYSTEGVVQSSDGGVTWEYACGHPPNLSTVVAWSVHTLPSNSSVLWAVFDDHRLYFSEDRCLNWTRVEGLNDTVFHVLAPASASASAPDSSHTASQEVLFAPGFKGVWASGPGWSSGLGQWVLLPGSPTAWTYSTTHCTGSPSDATKLVCAAAWWDQWHSGLWVANLTTAQQALATGSGPSGWSLASQDATIYRWAEAPGINSTGSLQAIASNLNPYPEVSTAWGVNVSVDCGRTWSTQNDGLRMRRVSALAFSPDGTRLIAGLNGGGFYYADVSALGVAEHCGASLG
jgi:hypothetical protein